MAMINTGASSTTINSYEKGNPFYIMMLTLVATLGGLLFGYDTAVVNGAEEHIVSFYLTRITTDATYAAQFVAQYGLIMISTFSLVYVVIASLIVKLFNNKMPGWIINGALLAILIYVIIQLSSQVVPTTEEGLLSLVNNAKGFVIASALIGCIIGGALAGTIAKSIGRKNGLIISAIAFTLSAVGASFPESFNCFGVLDVNAFVIYRIIGGIGVGLASMLSPMYIAEIAPANIRGKLVSWNQFAIIFGMLVIYFVNYYITLSGDQEWLKEVGWRYMFLSGVIPAGIFLILLFFVPETPRYMALKGKDDKALKILKKIAGDDKADTILKEIKGTLHETNMPWLSYGFFVIFVGLLLSSFQQLVGINVVLYYASNIFRNLGLGSDASMLQTIIVGVINLLFTVVAIFTVDKFGRKPLMIIGGVAMGVSMLALGTAFYIFPNPGVGALICMLTYVAGFAMSWGPVTWVLLSEIFPNSIRGAMSIAVAMQWITNWVVSWTFPMMNDNEALTRIFNHGFSYWIYGVMGILAAIFVWKLVPETKGKSLEEIEEIWKKKKE